MSSTESPVGAGQGATHSARLLISCPDGPGIVAAVGNFLVDHDGPITTITFNRPERRNCLDEAVILVRVRRGLGLLRV